MDFHHLKYFVEVADQKSFSKAARNLHISQSAISRTIKALEDELGVVLFMRNAKSVELTDGGTIFLTHAKRVVFMFEHLKTDFENEFRLEQGSIRIGIPPITDAPIFAQLLGEFKKVYPQIELELYEQGSKKVEISVQEGLIDIGIICTKPNPKEFESFYLTSDPLSVIIPKGNPLAKEKEIRLEMLSEEAFVSVSYTHLRAHETDSYYIKTISICMTKSLKHVNIQGSNRTSYSKRANETLCYKR